MSLWSMKEVTRITGATESALRYYNAKGVLSPTVQEETGRRQWLYDDEAVRRARRILLLRRIGIPVESIAFVLEKVDSMDESLLKTRLDELREKRKAIDEQISVASMLLLLDQLSADAEVKDDLLDRMFETVCRDK